MVSPERPRQDKRFFVIRSTALRQVDVVLLIWCAALLAFGAIVAMGSDEGSGLASALLAHAKLVFSGFALSGAAALGARIWLRRRDFILVTDDRTYFFLSVGGRAVLCRRDELAKFREDMEGILLEFKGESVRIDDPAEVLILVHNILMRWRQEEGRQSDPAHIPPWALVRR